MTLEDFFTLTEMKNGLATYARVEELISRMKQQKDCVMTNVGDAVRQWSTVASTLAVTESEDCLNHFVKLNGLNFLNQWLQETLKYRKDIADSSVEELIHTLLGSLEKLPIDREQSIASGLHMTIEKLPVFEGVTKERVRDLSERWKRAGDDVSYQGIVRGGALGDDTPKCSADLEAVDSANFNNTTCREGNQDGNCRKESDGTETDKSNVVGCHDASQLDNTKDVYPAADRTIPSTSSITADANLGDTNMLASSLPSNSYQEHISKTDDSSICPAAEMTSRDTHSSPDAIGSHVDDKAWDTSMLKDGSAKETVMEVDIKEGSPCKAGHQDSSNVLPSSSFSASSPAQKPERSVSCNFDLIENKYHVSKKMETLSRSASVDCVAPNFLRTRELKSFVQELHGVGSKLMKRENIDTSFQRKEVVESDSEADELGSASDLIVRRDASNPQEFSNMGKNDQTSELGFEDGELDALEVARQVAIEVEREVVDYREPFCSSSPEGSSGEVILAQSSSIIEKCKQDHPAKEKLNGSVALPGKNLSGGPSSQNDDNQKNLETDFGSDTCQDEMPKQITDAYKSSGKSDRGRFDFDLNEAVGYDEYDYLVNPVPNSSGTVSAPIAVAASKGAPLLPAAPICFEGEQGWKGSAATSAFRPASPRKTDAEKTSAGQKRKSNLIEIDLNVAESGDDDVTPVPYAFHSQDDSMEICSRRADRLKLDLNRLGDDGVLDQFSYWRHPHRNPEQAISPASSSSSRPSVRDFDLNDNPGFFDFIGSHNHKNSSTKATGMCPNSKLDVSAITIMGSRMAAERKDFLNDTRQSFMGGGQSIEPTAMLSSRPMLPYAHIPLSTYGYNGPMMGPPVPFASSVYGPGSFPYMMDSRGTTAVPQIMGGAGLHGASSATPSFLASVPNATSGSSVVVSTRSFLDLNPGLSTIESGNRDVGSLKHVFMQGHNGLMEKR